MYHIIGSSWSGKIICGSQYVDNVLIFETILEKQWIISYARNNLSTWVTINQVTMNNLGTWKGIVLPIWKMEQQTNSA